MVAAIWIAPELIPFSFSHFFRFGSLIGILKTAWPLFVWGVGLSILKFLYRKWRKQNNLFIVLPGGPLVMIFQGFLENLWAGIMEELSFRWSIFYFEILLYQVLNYICLSLFNFGFFEWFFLNITGPIADFFTLGYMHSILFGYGWVVGAAILNSNALFRNGHIYQGFFGFVNSWFLGMFLFYVMFQHGLFAAMFVHFTYNFLIWLVLVVYIQLQDRSLLPLVRF